MQSTRPAVTSAAAEPELGESVEAHERAVRRALEKRAKAPENWVPGRPGTDQDVLVVGAGQSGIAIAFSLRRAGISRTLVIDAAEEGAEGIWLAPARMNRLRSPKTLPGPELDIPELGFQPWYEARHGEGAYAALQFISRLDWAAYLCWYRETVGVPVRFGTRLQRIDHAENGLRLELSGGGQVFEVTCRKLVLATGFAGSGTASLPAFITGALPRHLYAHAEDPIDFETMRGRRIAVFGAGSAAFDAAATALESGASAVHLFCRHDDIERYSLMRVLYYPGSVEHFRELPDAERWRIMSALCRRAQGPVPDTVERTVRFPNFHLHLGAANPVLAFCDGAVRVSLSGKDIGLRFDFVVAGTGFRVDLSARPELAGFVEHVALWRDRYLPPADKRNPDLERSPYLSPGFALTEKVLGTAPHLRDIHLFSAGALMSNGRNPGEVSGLRHGVPQLVSAIGADLFRADAAKHVVRILKRPPPLLTGEEYRHRIWKGEPEVPSASNDEGGRQVARNRGN